MQKRSIQIFVVIFFLFLNFSLFGAISFKKYHTPDQINKVLMDLADINRNIVKLRKLAVTPGEKGFYLIEIGPEIHKKAKSTPAILVVANPFGDLPVTSEAALRLVEMLIGDKQYHTDKTWYVVPVLNPDAAAKYFKRPLYKDQGNNKPYNDDMDDQVDEDGPDDLDGNGIITMMRVKRPDGNRVLVKGEERLMKKPDWKKGESGIYKLYTEGIDNDKDGKINEDPPGGINVGVNFPHLFKFFTKKGGGWAGSEEESFNLIKFVNEHREIAMTMVFGDTNFCFTPPQGGRRGTSDFSSIKIPERVAKMFGADHTKTYTMKEIMEMAQKVVPPGMKLTEGMVASFLGLGAVVNPLKEDLEFYKKLSDDFKEFLKKKKINTERFAPKKANDGSFELWAYYHLGIPSFSLDFWSLPKPKKEKKKDTITPEQLEKMTNEEFLALGEDKIEAFLKDAGAPPQMKADQIIQALKGGMMDTKRMASMMKQMAGSGPKKDAKGADEKEKAMLEFSDKVLKGKGFIKWKPYNHPTLGEVEIGGFVPYADGNPPAGLIKKTVDGPLPWVFKLTDQLPSIKFYKTEVEALDKGVYRIKAWLENKNLLPYPTAMGQRNNRILPVIITLNDKDIKILQGKKRMFIDNIPGYGKKSVEWMIYSKKPQVLTLKSITNIAGKDSVKVDLRSAK